MKKCPLGLRPLRLALWAGGALLWACASEPRPPDDPLIQGSYGTNYDPPQLVGPTGDCIRSIPHAVLSVNSLGDFDLSVNTIDNCVGDTGPEIVFGEELFLTAPAPLFTARSKGNTSG